MAAQVASPPSLTVSVDGAVDAARVSAWAACTRAGGAVELNFPDAASLEAARLPLLLGGFALTAGGATTLTATRAAPAAGGRKLLKKKKTATKAAADDDDDVVDEDDLLAADGLTPPEVDADACSARQPCANCTCGRKEELDAANAAGDAPPPKSACGNCGKGDAFRCAGCPYLGKPAFDAGQENVVLDLSTDDF